MITHGDPTIVAVTTASLISSSRHSPPAAVLSARGVALGTDGGAISDPRYMSRQIQKFRTDKVDSESNGSFD